MRPGLEKLSGKVNYSKDDLIVLISAKANLKGLSFSDAEQAYVSEKLKDKNSLIELKRLGQNVIIYQQENADKAIVSAEKARKAGHKVQQRLNAEKVEKATLIDLSDKGAIAKPFCEGLVLGSYKFLKYKSDAAKSGNTLLKVQIQSDALDKKDLKNLNALCQAVFKARDLVNEPLISLSAVQLANEFRKMGKEADISVEVFNKNKIESLKMGGLLAVNTGSIDPPTFTIMEYKPKKVVNKKPYIFVGKGVVYDTGGLSLKPTANSMDYMKCDMAGAAAAGCALYAIALMELPVHVIALIPATDNRPGGNAYTPGDVITMHSGTTVEVLNTDAEGRLILGDALSYAKKFKPELVIDLATLTGAAAAAIGPYGIVGMGTASEQSMTALAQAGEAVYERIAPFPFWDEYDDLIKSDIADIKNVGGPNAGAITAGKFLARFIDYPWYHLDIAGPAYSKSDDSYRGKNGTGVGVRLLVEFITRIANKTKA